MPRLPHRAAAVLASACLVCALGAAGLTLSDDLPDRVAGALLARVTAKVEQGGATDVEGLGRPFLLSRNGTPIGAILPGRSLPAGSDDHMKTCFVALVEAGTQSVAVVPAPSRGSPGSAGCQGYTALGLLPSRPGTVRLGILYDMTNPPLTVPVVLAWRDGQVPAVDIAGTAACGARHVTTIAAMRRPGCGRASALDRAFHAVTGWAQPGPSGRWSWLGLPVPLPVAGRSGSRRGSWMPGRAAPRCQVSRGA